MTVSTTVNKAFFDGSGSTGPFTFNFRFFTNSDIYVVKTVNGVDTTLAETTDYTLTGANSYSGGSVTLTTALAVGEKLTIYRTLSIKQLTDLRNHGAFFAETHEDVFDRLTMVDQQQKESIDRAIKLPVSSYGISAELPTPDAYQVIGWDNTGTALQNYNRNEFVSIVSYGTAIADTFTGTGSQVDFTLSYTPYNVNNLDVSISGVTQIPGVDYTWTSGTTLTFGTAPASGLPILARYFRGLPQGSIDWASVTSSPFVSSTVYINTSITASALGYTEINMLKGGLFSIATGVTFTIDVPFTCGLFQCFSGDGSVVFESNEVETVWFGSGSYNANKAIASCPSNGIVRLYTDTWTTTVTVPYTKNQITIDGNSAVITFSGNDDCILYQQGPSNNYNGKHVIKNLTIIGPNSQFGGARPSTGAGINYASRSYCTSANVDISGFRYGIKNCGLFNLIEQNSYCHNNDYGVYYYSTLDACNANIIIDSKMRENFRAGVWYADNLDPDGIDNFVYEIQGNKITNSLIESNKPYPYSPQSGDAPPNNSVGVYIGDTVSRISIVHTYIENHSASIYTKAQDRGYHVIDTVSMTGGVIIIAGASGRTIKPISITGLHNTVAKPAILIQNSDYPLTGFLDIKDSYGIDCVAYAHSATNITATGAESTDVFTSSSHGLVDGDIVYTVSGNIGASPGALFWVINSATSTFQLSNTKGGTAINIRANGSSVFIKTTYRYNELYGHNLNQNSGFYGVEQDGVSRRRMYINKSTAADADLLHGINGFGTLTAKMDVSNYETFYISPPSPTVASEQLTLVTGIYSNKQLSTGRLISITNAESPIRAIVGFTSAAMGGLPNMAEYYWMVNDGDTINIDGQSTGTPPTWKCMGIANPNTTRYTHANYQGQLYRGKYVAKYAFDTDTEHNITVASIVNTTTIQLHDTSDHMKDTNTNIFSVVTSENGLSTARTITSVSGSAPLKTVTFYPALTGTETIPEWTPIRLTTWVPTGWF